MYAKFIKRTLDFLLALVALTVLSPVMFVLAISIAINMGTPVLFRQKRVGKDNKVFMMYKFRSMNSRTDENGKLLPDDQRVTGLGRFLRGSSLDELPELINILKGDISIVGPRPLLPEYLPYYTEYEAQRHKVRGGLTVPEVLYDNMTPTWEEQFRYEVEYANHVTFATDARIILNTIKEVFKRGNDGYGSYVRKSLIEEREEQNEQSCSNSPA